ncbi:hypothetical protein H112_03703 [Trichophyton rubrum D6]|uniref:Uncharacterized protein n=4 Tax=Trichophyton TaxID=5550 RepID=A0A178EXW2_TRIRU|nr:uncharacterized protein TERG_12228 [Trichophyton rubrum CBS 118892]EZF23623.1 hypothetical protein H100_03711 [Trichophyton rubrum MR850]EZF42658.1 hypothetical protein H102_03701 [Trichophyton rubrum CBS 100081]EZF53335.1 hypothetical protein H103_03714 [Trichophyton rubrum CBS 288.86]EZF63947.1 hypothetical protein H104_03699 [Trichophyton rubrum CBS 289.86]EZF74527.1 hypothetical protein H105_03728 [Trichophyton soudanense CBS 452.61]EZF85220.1 hypothetical protein H110_03711 [Trichophy
MTSTRGRHDCLQPRQGDLDDTLHKVRQYWHNLAQQAVTQYRNGIPFQYLRPENIPKHVPAMLDAESRGTSNKFVSRGVLYSAVERVWVTSEDGERGINGKQKTRAALSG